MTSDPLKSNTIKQPSTGGTAKNLLVIRLPLTVDDDVYWSTDSDYGTTSVLELGELKQLTSTHRCKILVPGEAVGLHAVEHSGKLNRTVLQTLPWHLEDMHFALLSHSDGKAYMAVVAKSFMEQWQVWLSNAGINSRQWLPDSLSLSFTVGKCTVLQLNDQYLVRTGEWQAAVCDPSWLPLYLESLHSESGTVWSGQAGEVTVNNVTLTSVNWDIKPSALLGQAIEADITVGDLQSPVSAEATVRATTSEVSLTDTTVDVSAQWLQSRLLMPDFVAVDVLGNINLDVQAMSFTQEGCQNLDGLIALQRSRLNSPFGGVRLGDAGARLSCEAGTLTASVNQSSSDIATEGQFTLRPNMSFNLAATLTPGEELPEQMKQGLDVLGQPEGDNAYSLRFSGRL